MPDREKVSYGLHCMCYGDVECKECPYAKDGSGWHDCRSNCAKDALALLKEQEAVEPITEHHLFLCPVCKNTLFREQKFCHECGKRIKWEGR